MEEDPRFERLARDLPRLPDSASDELSRLGYTAMRGLLPMDRITRLRSSFDERIAIEGAAAGSEFQQEEGCLRLSNCINKSEDLLLAAFFEPVLAAAVAVIGRPFKLHGYNARNPLPGGGGQALHRDIDTGPQLEGRMTNGSRDLINAIWVLDDFTDLNGPTRVVPGSHLHSRHIDDEMVDPTARRQDERLLTAAAGTIFIVNGALWHSGTPNESGAPRRSLHISFVERHHPQQVEQRTHIEQWTFRRLSSMERYILDV